MTLPIRIEKEDIPLFISGCGIEALQWEIEGVHFEQWRAERNQGDDPSSAWRNEVVIPYLKRQFEALLSASDVMMNRRII